MIRRWHQLVPWPNACDSIDSDSDCARETVPASSSVSEQGWASEPPTQRRLGARGLAMHSVVHSVVVHSVVVHSVVVHSATRPVGSGCLPGPAGPAGPASLEEMKTFASGLGPRSTSSEVLKSEQYAGWGFCCSQGHMTSNEVNFLCRTSSPAQPCVPSEYAAPVFGTRASVAASSLDMPGQPAAKEMSSLDSNLPVPVWVGFDGLARAVRSWAEHKESRGVKPSLLERVIERFWRCRLKHRRVEPVAVDAFSELHLNFGSCSPDLALEAATVLMLRS